MKPDWSHIAKPAVVRPHLELAARHARMDAAFDRPIMLDAAGIPTSVPMETPNNENRREHWAPKAARTKRQRAAMRRAVAKWLEWRGPLLRITVTRIGPRRVDPTNLGSCLKATVDGISDALRLDDGSLAVEWVLQQAKGKTPSVRWHMDWISSEKASVAVVLP
jgi:hypothetical protein